MEKTSYKKTVLLTGAGFTANVGGFLADEMWARILNHPKLINQSNLIKTMIDENHQFNYEALYQEVLNSGKFNVAEKEAFQKAISAAYNNLNKIVLDHSQRSQLMDLALLEKFILSFSGNKDEVGAVFTLNQDLFLESLLYNGRDPPKINIPLVPNYPFKDGSGLSNQKGIEIPNCVDEANAISELKKPPYLNYFKLHGSFGWYDSSKKDQIIIGQMKSKTIQGHPFLKWNYDQFKFAINCENVRLLIVGYGFRDEHINTELRNAGKKNNLKIFIIQPDSPRDFCSRFLHRKGSDRGDNRELWNFVNGYFPYSLQKIFSKDDSGKQYQEELLQHFPF